MVEDRFSTREVTRQTGATARQLQWWDENRLIVPRREAGRRIYSLEQLFDVRLMLELRRSHLALESVHRVLSFFRNKSKPRLAEIACAEEEYLLLVNDKGQWLVSSAEELMDKAARVAQPVYVFSVSQILGGLRGIYAHKLPVKRAVQAREVHKAG